MIRSVYFTAAGKKKTGLTEPEMSEALKDKDGLLWISLEGSSEEEMNRILKNCFHFHPLAIEDCQSDGYQTPKVDDFGDYIFLIAYAIRPQASYADPETLELDFFLGENYLVTSYRGTLMPPVETVWQRLERDSRLSGNGSDFLCHAVLDVLVDDYMPFLDQMYGEMDLLEDLVLSDPQPKTLSRLLELKHCVMILRRILSPQRELINRLSRDEFPMIDRQSRIYFRDIYDHFVRTQELIDAIRDIATGALDIYLSSTSNRLNQIMKALTVVSTIFLPLSFVAGVYGMNFQAMPEIYWKYGYLMAWGIFSLIFIGMLAFFKWRKWF